MTELFFSEQLDDIAAAKSFCLECPVMETCLEGAMERREPWGVWGGQLFVHGKIVAQKRKRGRPPKVRPETEVPHAQSA
jgi:WhiB family redox-sensing transcriptional regulator